MNIKKLYISLLTISLFLMSFVYVSADVSTEVKAQSVEGLVQYRLPGQSEWADLEVGLMVPVNSTLISGRNGSAILGTGSSTIELEPLSRIEVSLVDVQVDHEQTEVEMRYGSIRSRVRRSSNRGTDFSVRSPVSTASVRGTDFAYNGRELRVFSGDVAFANLTGQQHSVRAGQTSRTYRHLPIESVEATLLDRLRF